MTPIPDEAAGRSRWAWVLGVAVVALVLALMVVLHLTGVLGGGTH